MRGSESGRSADCPAPSLVASGQITLHRIDGWREHPPLRRWSLAPLLKYLVAGSNPCLVMVAFSGGVPGVVEKEKWRILPVGEVHDQPACQGGHRRNAPWTRVSASQSERMSLSPSR